MPACAVDESHAGQEIVELIIQDVLAQYAANVIYPIPLTCGKENVKRNHVLMYGYEIFLF